MKKSVVLMLGAASLLLASFFVSCKQVGQYDANLSGGVSVSDISDLKDPVLNGASYYGVNYVWWDAVAGAHSYSVYRNGKFIKSVKIDEENCTYEDTDIENGKKYRYQVIAVSASDPSRAASVRSSTATIELTAIVPTVEQYNKAVNDSLGITDGVASKISIVSGDKGYIVVDFPSKAYLNYTIYTVEKGLVNQYSDPLSLKTVADADKEKSADYLTENSTIRAAIPVVAAGEKEIYVLATPKAENAVTGWGSVLAKTNATIKYETIDELAASNTGSAVWTSEANKTARVYWKPATVSTGLKAPTTDFVVYRKQAGEWAKVAGTVTNDTTTDYYYIDDELPLLTADATYYIVHKHGEFYGTNLAVKLTASKLGNAGAAIFDKDGTTSAAIDEDKIANDVLVTVSIPVDVTLAAVEYTESQFKLADYSYKALTIPAVTTDANGRKVYVISGKDFDDGTYVFRAKTTKEGYADTFAYSKDVTVDSSLTATDAATLKVTLGDYADDGSSNDAYITATAANKNQTLTLAYGYSDKSAAAAKAAFYEGAKSVTFPDKSSTVSGAKKYELILDNLADGYYFFVLTASEAGYNAITTTASTTVATDELPSTADEFTLAVEFGDYADDGTANDAFFTVSAANNEQTLALAYGYSDKSAAAAKAAYYKASTAIELPVKYSIVPGAKKYEFIKGDFADGYYFFVLTATEDGHTSVVKTYAKSLDTSVEITKTGDPTLTITANAYGSDNAKNDLYIYAKKANANQKLKLYYGYSKNSAEEAKAEARTKNNTWELPAVGYNDAYRLIKEDVEDGYYFAYLYAEEEGCKPNEATKAFAIDTAVEDPTAETPWWVWINNLGTNGKTFRILGSHTEDFELVYGYSTLGYTDAEYNAYATPTKVALPEDYTADGWGADRGFDVKDLKPGYYWFVINCKKEGRTPVSIDYNSKKWIEYDEPRWNSDTNQYDNGEWEFYYAGDMRFEILDTAVTPSEDDGLGDIIIDGDVDINNLTFINKDGDGKFDDLNAFTVTVSEKASIKAVRYYAATNETEAKNLVLSGGKAITVPTKFVRKFANDDPDDPGEIVKIYDFYDALNNVKVFDDDGNKLYYAFIVEIDDDSEESWNHKYRILTATPDVMPIYNKGLKLQVLLGNNDAGTYENDLNVSIKDVVVSGDSIANYTYTLQKAEFSLETGNLTVLWTDLEKDIKLEVEEANPNELGYSPYDYVYSKAYKDFADGIYMFRVVKTSKLDGGVIGATIYNPYKIQNPVPGTTVTNYDTLSDIRLAVTEINETKDGNSVRTKAALWITLPNDNNKKTTPWTADTNYKYSIYRASYKEIHYWNTSAINSYVDDTIVIDNYVLRELALSAVTHEETVYKDDGTPETNADGSEKKVTVWDTNEYKTEDNTDATSHYFYYVKAVNEKTGMVLYSPLVSLY